MGLTDLFDDFPRLSVSQYTAAVKRTLEKGIAPCWVLGEVSNFRRQSSGHLYFSLKDSGAQLPAVMFRGQASAIGFAPRDGMEVLAFGEISVYEPYGRYQLIVRELRESGQGRLFREFERLKRKLAEEGLFDAERKRPLPSLPLKVAVVTSPTGAALQDFLRILKRRAWRGHLQVFPVKVQGQGAADQIVEAIRLANRIGGYDLLVVARGGGSIEDLWCFNEEVVARAVSESAIPTLSGVGHEIDFTLSDFAADVRAETPSAAAEIISSAYLACLDRLEEAREALSDALEFALSERAQELEARRARLKAVSPAAALERSFLRVDELSARLSGRFHAQLHRREAAFAKLERRFLDLDVKGIARQHAEAWRDLSSRLRHEAEKTLRHQSGRLELARARLGALSPEAVLKRGFALLRDGEGRPVSGVRSVKAGDRARAVLRDGTLDLTIDAARPSQPGREDGAEA